jgi:tetratricopeptide (TPR) repeat protein
MSHAWNIVTDILSLLFVLACFGYAGYRTLDKSTDPARLVFKWVLTVVVIFTGIYTVRQFPPTGWPGVAAAFAVVVGIIWGTSIGEMVAAPLTGMFDGGGGEAEKKPMYSYAEARRRKGLPAEAIVEVRKVLAEFPADFTGVLLLANIQAEDLKDLPAAEATMEAYLAQPKLSPAAVSAALQNLADLRWRCGAGAAAAAEALTRITTAYPDTSHAHAALQRIAHLEAADQTRQQRVEAHYNVPTGERDVGLRVGALSALQTVGPEEEAARLVQQLERHPADVETREKLALLYAEEYGRVDLAAEQLEQLIALRHESPRRVANWLNLLATVYARFGNDRAAAEETLRRVLERFPKSTMAEAALTRLASLNLEVKSHQPTQAKTLGVYEKQIGLKN